MNLLEQIKNNNLSKKEIVKFSERIKINQEKYPNWRLGQCFFNSLYEIKPELANILRGTSYDPFHMDYKKALNILTLLTNSDEYKE
jgi:hypothetical protein